MSDSASVPGGVDIEDLIERIEGRIDDVLGRVDDIFDRVVDDIRERADDIRERADDIRDRVDNRVDRALPGGLDNFNDAFGPPGEASPSDDFFASERSPFFDPDPLA